MNQNVCGNRLVNQNQKKELNLAIYRAISVCLWCTKRFQSDQKLIQLVTFCGIRNVMGE